MGGESHAGYVVTTAESGSLAQQQNSAHLTSTAVDVPPFNPLQTSNLDGVTNSNEINSAIGSSVVRDLMRVYENLTQSSTPQQVSSTNTLEPGSEVDGQHLYQQQPPGGTVGYGMAPPSYQASSSSNQATSYAPPEQAHPKSSYIPYDTEYGGRFVTSSIEYPPNARDQQGSPAGPSSVKSEEQDDDVDAAGEESDEQGTSSGGRTSSRRKRRGSHDTSISAAGSSGRSGTTKSKKKSKTQDGRWSKRFTWPEDLHRDFVSAIFDVGLKHSSPSTILEHMPKHEQITTERIKSHLQKYRLHRIKSKKEFIASYESSLRNFQSRPDMGKDGQVVSGAGVAAQLSFSAIGESENSSKDDKGGDTDEQIAQPHAAPTSADPVSKVETENDHEMIGGPLGDQRNLSNSHLQPETKSDSLMLPQLTEAEKQSPIGAAMGYLMGLFFSLKQQLMIQRSLEASGVKAKSDAPLQEVFNSFVAGGAPAAAAAVGQATTSTTGVPSVRINIEENSMMKREMQNQKALQNKMRALKQHELAKYKNIGSSAPTTSTGAVHKGTVDGGMGLSIPPPNQEEEFAVQGAGETAGNDGSAEYHRGGGNTRPHSLSFGGSEEFWNTDVVDEQLFEFLMNN